MEKADKIVLKEQILEHVASEPATIDDPTKWQQEQREDRNLPFVADEA